MIEVTLEKDVFNNIRKIQVKGHARFAEFGKDIVCASVSILFQTVGFMLVEREDALAVAHFHSGDSSLEIGNPSRESHLITSVFEYGVSQISEQYPDHVRLKVK